MNPNKLKLEKSLLFALYGEQKRIVTRANTLLRLCDDLSAHLREAQATRTALRDAVLAA